MQRKSELELNEGAPHPLSDPSAYQTSGAESRPTPERPEVEAAEGANPATILAVSAFALAKGLPRDEIEDCLGGPLRHFNEGVGRIRADAAPRLCAALAENYPETALPVELGRALPPSFVNEVGHTAQFASSVGEALQVFSRFAPLLADNATCELDATPKYLAMRLGHPAAHLDGGLMNAITISFLWKFLGELAAEPLSAQEVRMPSSRGGAEAAYKDYFRASVQFEVGPQEGSLILPKRVAEATLKRSNPGAFDYLIERLAERLQSIIPAPTDNEIGLLREAVREGLLRGDSRVSSVAQSLNMSVRSAQRLAARSGTTLRQLLDEELVALTKSMLYEDPQRSIDSIAAALGYSEARSLNRSFQRVSGMTPGAFRRQLI